MQTTQSVLSSSSFSSARRAPASGSGLAAGGRRSAAASAAAASAAAASAAAAASEVGTTGALAAGMNAIVDALATRGVTEMDMPATPPRVWAALNGN